MHVLIVALSSARGPSGICRHAHNLAHCASIREEITQVTLLIGRWQEKYFNSFSFTNDPKIKVFCVDIANTAFLRNLWYLRDLPHVMEKLQVDIVHLSFPVPVWHRKIKCPIVVSLHDFYPYDEPENFGYPKVLFNRFFLQQCLKSVDAVACVSETTLNSLERRMPRVAHRKGTVIYNCADLKMDKLSCSSPMNIKGAFFFMVAQHRANKNIKLMLQVFKDYLSLQEFKKDTILLLLGNIGPETDRIRHLIEQLCLEENVRMMDGITDTQLLWCYEECDLLLAPSLNEGFGFPVIEALLHGRRVVCSDIPIFREIGADACHYFNLNALSASRAMLESIHRALAEPSRRIAHPERFSLQNISTQYAMLYRQLLMDLEPTEGRR